MAGLCWFHRRLRLCREGGRRVYTGFTVGWGFVGGGGGWRLYAGFTVGWHCVRVGGGVAAVPCWLHCRLKLCWVGGGGWRIHAGFTVGWGYVGRAGGEVGAVCCWLNCRLRLCWGRGGSDGECNAGFTGGWRCVRGGGGGGRGGVGSLLASL